MNPIHIQNLDGDRVAVSPEAFQEIVKSYGFDALDSRPLLYTDTIHGKTVGRDDMWVVTSTEIAAVRAAMGRVQSQPVVAIPAMTDERSEFEAFYRRDKRIIPGAPGSPHIENMWTAWQARAELAQPVVTAMIDALQMAKHVIDRDGTQEQLDQVFAALELAGITP